MSERLAVGQIRVTPLGQRIVITKVDHGRRLVWGERESDGRPLGKGRAIGMVTLEGLPIDEADEA